MSEIDLTISSSGEDLTVFEIMQRYRSDGSCEDLVRQALVALARRGHSHHCDNPNCTWCNRDRYERGLSEDTK